MVGFGRRFGSRRLVRVESLFTKVPGSTVLVGFGLFWCVFWVAAVGLGRIFAYVGAGLDGFGRFWSVFWVVADNLGRIFIYVGAGLDGFEMFSALLDAIF